MSLTPELSLDEATQSELRRAIAGIPDDDAVGYAIASAAFQNGGFRATQAGRVRERIGQLLDGAAPIDEALRRLLARHSLNRTVIAPLSVSAVASHRRALEALFDAPGLRLAMLLDERPDVRALALLPPQPDGTPGPALTRAEAIAELQGLLGTLCGALTPPDGESHDQSRAPLPEAATRLQERLQACQADLRHLKGAAARAERLQTQLAERATELQALRSELEKSQAEARAARRAAEKAEAELERDRRHAELQVQTMVEARLAEEFAGWLGGARARIAAAATGGHSDDALLQRAEAVLAAQAGADRVSGQRAAIQQRLERLEAALARCRDALAQAMRPLPELGAVTGDLASEAAGLRRLLDLEACSPLRSTLAAALNTATAAQLPELRATLERLSAIGALEPTDMEALAGIAKRRLAVLTLEARAPAEAADSDPETSVGRLRAALAGRKPTILLIDGHNTLFSLQSRYLPPQLKGLPDWNARNRLVDDLIAMTAGRPTCRAWIVFDGPVQSDHSPAHNVRVSYSGGTGEHRADRLLTDNVRFCVQSGAEAVLLVTNDGPLMATAERLGARTLSPLELLKHFAN
ncbi:MAG: NYN domain-containing protein [Kiritimatiellae bacterium]|nr:NYN domain-containing protein [Kiritimatiellia bacterium]